MIDNKHKGQQLYENEIYIANVPFEFELMVRVPKAIPPVECSIYIHKDSVLEAKKLCSSSIWNYCFLDYIIPTEGLNILKVNLSYITNITATRVFKINAIKGENIR